MGNRPTDRGRRSVVLRVRVVVGIALSLMLTATPASAEHAVSTPVEDRALGELDDFTRWLAENEAKGFIGEVGWPGGETSPDSEQWDHLAERWLDHADSAGLWVNAWATGEWWPADYRLAIYTATGGAVDTPSTQASVLEPHLGRGHGINVAGGEFAAPSNASTSSFSNKNPGIYGVDYHYDSAETFHYLASRGVRMVRIPFRWERLQPRLSGPLSRGEVRRLSNAADRAGRAGLDVVLDMHNYGAYYRDADGVGIRRAIGTRGCSVSDFVDVWRRLSKRFAADAIVVGYGLMNEPIGIPATAQLTPAERWERMSQRALDAIRGRGDTTTILVPGYNWSGVRSWRASHPDGWIHDPVGRFRYEAHHYWDEDQSGTYALSYDEEVARASSYSR